MTFIGEQTCNRNQEIFKVWRSKLHYIATGIITLKQVSCLKLLWAHSSKIYERNFQACLLYRPITYYKHVMSFFDVLLTVLLSIFISLFNQLDAQNLFHSKFYFVPLHVSSTCAHHQEVKIALHSLWWWAHVLEHVEAWTKTYCETNVCINLVK